MAEEMLEQQKAQCPFCKIVKGEIPAFKVFEDELILAVADINPAAKGHILVLPKEHYPILQLLPPATSTRLFDRIKYIEKGVKSAVPTDAATIYVANGYAAGQQTAHFLVHVLPRDKGDSLQQFALKAADNIDEGKFTQLAAGIKSAIGKYIGGSSGTNVATKQQVSEEQKKILAKLIESDAQIKDLLLNNPDELIKKISVNQKLAAVFAGVDVKTLSQKLKGAM